LRAFTPRDQKAVKSAAETFRTNPAIDTVVAITELKTGEALVSVLDDHGSPTPVERILISPPRSRIGPLSKEERSKTLNRSPLKGRYDETIDRESAHEVLKKRTEEQQRMHAAEKAEKENTEIKQRSNRSRSRRQSVGEAMVKSAARSIGSALGRRIIRGIMGSLLGGR
jgi:hypothetical protein